MEQGVLDVVKLKYWSFIPRRGSGRRQERALGSRGWRRARSSAARRGEPLTEEELTALFAETRPEVIEEMRVAADELRAELAGETATFVVNRNINFTNVCVVGCAFCGFGQGKRSPDAYHVSEEDFAARVREAVEFGATEICMQGGIHPDYALEDYGRWLRLAKEARPRSTCTPTRRWRSTTCASAPARSPDAVFEYLIECGLGSTPGTAAEVLDDGVRAADLAEQAARRALGRDHRGLPPRRAALDLDGDVRPHRGAAGAGAPHAGRPRAPGAHRRDHRVRAAQLHPLQHAARAHPRRRGDLARDENLKHTAAFRLALGRTIPNLQASWVKMGLDAATESLRWGVNDLGGTLMEENISRMAGSQHGVRLEPRAADRRRPPGRADPGPADDALRDRRDLLAG